MIGELEIGRRYRISLKSRALAGWLEGVLRSVQVPPGFLGNDDGAHSVWLVGETFEWFLRPDEIGSIDELPPEPDDAALSVGRLCEMWRHPSRVNHSTARASRPAALDAVPLLPHRQSRTRPRA